MPHAGLWQRQYNSVSGVRGNGTGDDMKAFALAVGLMLCNSLPLGAQELFRSELLIDDCRIAQRILNGDTAHPMQADWVGAGQCEGYIHALMDVRLSGICYPN